MSTVQRLYWRRPKRILLYVLAALLATVLILMNFIALPYYIYAPGEALPLQPMVDVQGGHKTDKGAFLMTTVYVVYAANVYDFLYGLFLPHHQILPATEVNGGLTNSQYDQLEAFMMKAAHQNAEIAALHYLHKPISIATLGVIVLSVERGSTAYGHLVPGDVITGVNGISLSDPNRIFTVLQHAKVGEPISLTVLHHGRIEQMTLHLKLLPAVAGQVSKRPGLGVFLAPDQVVHSPIHITIHSGDIDGPSAGLMFTLEIINQLAPGNLTKGYRIAGTGTMSANGSVGQIGGAAHKVVAASEAGAQYFFVPADTAAGDTNALHAIEEARKIGTHMKVIPVKTLQQAINFLQSLPPKTG
ncbi:SepM family pheromone-processing serine protease [Sulfoacidibacillus thermotolerans]|uniref:endopeptidase La n=1 Tax=Sulfoacidibacillus thermotolerans TaxID=1765684 RepID=A0A2U3D7U2_SULT2|nr:SepM family pheromone-processing serine protease [Sulfoacidibacillus thermotolerans]PWI57347.1 hypothetical protein BM613_09125 [Sulfoacidibacillus thermotolerans]